MLVRELKEICEPLGIQYECRWGAGFQVSARDERTIKDGLRPLGFTVKGIGIGRDFNRNCIILYVERG
jgi:hypothetical protein